MSAASRLAALGREAGETAPTVRASLEDGESRSFRPAETFGLVMIAGEAAQTYGLVQFRLEGGVEATKIAGGAGLEAASGGAAAADGVLTVTAGEDARLHLENRTGGTLRLAFLIVS